MRSVSSLLMPPFRRVPIRHLCTAAHILAFVLLASLIPAMQLFSRPTQISRRWRLKYRLSMLREDLRVKLRSSPAFPVSPSSMADMAANQPTRELVKTVAVKTAKRAKQALAKRARKLRSKVRAKFACAQGQRVTMATATGDRMDRGTNHRSHAETCPFPSGAILMCPGCVGDSATTHSTPASSVFEHGGCRDSELDYLSELSVRWLLLEAIKTAARESAEKALDLKRKMTAGAREQWRKLDDKVDYALLEWEFRFGNRNWDGGIHARVFQDPLAEVVWPTEEYQMRPMRPKPIRQAQGRHLDNTQSSANCHKCHRGRLGRLQVPHTDAPVAANLPAAPQGASRAGRSRHCNQPKGASLSSSCGATCSTYYMSPRDPMASLLERVDGALIELSGYASATFGRFLSEPSSAACSLDSWISNSPPFLEMANSMRGCAEVLSASSAEFVRAGSTHLSSNIGSSRGVGSGCHSRVLEEGSTCSSASLSKRGLLSRHSGSSQQTRQSWTDSSKNYAVDTRNADASTCVPETTDDCGRCLQMKVRVVQHQQDILNWKCDLRTAVVDKPAKPSVGPQRSRLVADIARNYERLSQGV